MPDMLDILTCPKNVDNEHCDCWLTENGACCWCGDPEKPRKECKSAEQNATV